MNISDVYERIHFGGVNYVELFLMDVILLTIYLYRLKY